MPVIHEQIKTAIRHLDTEAARRLVNEALEKQPNAELYYLASLVASSVEQRQDYLEKALSLDPEHLEAASELSKMQKFPFTERRKSRPLARKKIVSLFVSLVLLLGITAFYIKENYFYTKLPAYLAGEWVGDSYSDAVGSIHHVITIRQEGGRIVGTSSGETTKGRADVYLSGSYENGYLNYETYGGTFSGWDGVCQFHIILEYREIDDIPYLIGTYETISTQEGRCSYNGTIEFSRP
jgi:hypothetical protein